MSPAHVPTYQFHKTRRSLPQERTRRPNLLTPSSATAIPIPTSVDWVSLISCIWIPESDCHPIEWTPSIPLQNISRPQSLSPPTDRLLDGEVCKVLSSVLHEGGERSGDSLWSWDDYLLPLAGEDVAARRLRSPFCHQHSPALVLSLSLSLSELKSSLRLLEWVSGSSVHAHEWKGYRCRRWARAAWSDQSMLSEVNFWPLSAPPLYQ